MARRLTTEELKAVCDPGSLPFRSTEELPSLDGLIGQERAASATAFGVGMTHSGYNLFVLGPARTGKTSAMKRVLGKKAEGEPGPPDHCYVHNFADPYRPTALAVPAGRGRELRDEIEGFFDTCAARGLTGCQGVLIPESNVRHLMLRDDVIQGVREERFYIHAVSTVDEGLGLLSGREAGERGADGRFSAGSFNAAVDDALIVKVRCLKELRAAGSDHGPGAS